MAPVFARQLAPGGRGRRPAARRRRPLLLCLGCCTARRRRCAHHTSNVATTTNSASLCSQRPTDSLQWFASFAGRVSTARSAEFLLPSRLAELVLGGMQLGAADDMVSLSKPHMSASGAFKTSCARCTPQFDASAQLRLCAPGICSCWAEHSCDVSQAPAGASDTCLVLCCCCCVRSGVWPCEVWSGQWNCGQPHQQPCPSS